MSLREVVRPVLAFALLAGLAEAGIFASRVLHVPVPGPVIGILMLLLFLLWLGRLPAALKTVAGWLLTHLNLFYIPAAVGLLAHLALLRRDLLPIAAALIVSTFLALAAGAFVFQCVARWEEKARWEKKE